MPVLQAEPYYSQMKEKAWYRLSKMKSLGLMVQRFGGTFMFACPENKTITCCNAQQIRDMQMRFDAFEAFLQASLNDRFPWTTTADCIWYMMGFGSVFARTEYIDRAFAEHFEEHSKSGIGA